VLAQSAPLFVVLHVLVRVLVQQSLTDQVLHVLLFDQLLHLLRACLQVFGELVPLNGPQELLGRHIETLIEFVDIFFEFVVQGVFFVFQYNFLFSQHFVTYFQRLSLKLGFLEFGVARPLNRSELLGYLVFVLEEEC